MRRAITCVALLQVLWSSPPAFAQSPEQIVQVLPRDAIPAIDDPTFEPVARARGFDSAELMVGVVGKAEQRAYSTWQLDTHEIVNDAFEGQPIAVTWCPLCGTAVVYDRQVGGRTLSFGVSGMLFRDALVMYDRETGTLWSHVDGRALQGPLLGHTLRPLPSLHATWKEWRTLYPQGVVLEKSGFARSPYEDYNRDPERLGIFGRRLNRSALPPKENILGVRFGGAATAFVVSDVRRVGIVESEVGGVPIVLAALRRDLPVVVFERRVGDQVLTFSADVEPEPGLRDLETGSRWRLADGLAVEGPLAGSQLSRVVAQPAFWFGWYGYFPDSAVWRRPR